jgi:hypothetical protein
VLFFGAQQAITERKKERKKERTNEILLKTKT